MEFIKNEHDPTNIEMERCFSYIINGWKYMLDYNEKQTKKLSKEMMLWVCYEILFKDTMKNYGLIITHPTQDPKITNIACSVDYAKKKHYDTLRSWGKYPIIVFIKDTRQYYYKEPLDAEINYISDADKEVARKCIYYYLRKNSKSLMHTFDIIDAFGIPDEDADIPTNRYSAVRFDEPGFAFKLFNNDELSIRLFKIIDLITKISSKEDNNEYTVKPLSDLLNLNTMYQFIFGEPWQRINDKRELNLTVRMKCKGWLDNNKQLTRNCINIDAIISKLLIKHTTNGLNKNTKYYKTFKGIRLLAWLLVEERLKLGGEWAVEASDLYVAPFSQLIVRMYDMLVGVRVAVDLEQNDDENYRSAGRDGRFVYWAHMPFIEEIKAVSYFYFKYFYRIKLKTDVYDAPIPCNEVDPTLLGKYAICDKTFSETIYPKFNLPEGVDETEIQSSMVKHLKSTSNFDNIKQLAGTPELIILRGIPGCGKSFITDEYSKKGYIIVNTDSLYTDYSLIKCIIALNNAASAEAFDGLKKHDLSKLLFFLKKAQRTNEVYIHYRARSIIKNWVSPSIQKFEEDIKEKNLSLVVEGGKVSGFKDALNLFEQVTEGHPKYIQKLVFVYAPFNIAVYQSKNRSLVRNSIVNLYFPHLVFYNDIMNEMCNLRDFSKNAQRTLTVYAVSNSVAHKEIIKNGRWVSTMPTSLDLLSKKLFDIFAEKYNYKDKFAQLKEGFINKIEVIQNIMPTLLLVLLIVLVIILLYIVPIWNSVPFFINNPPLFRTH